MCIKIKENFYHLHIYILKKYDIILLIKQIDWKINNLKFVGGDSYEKTNNYFRKIRKNNK